MPAFRAVRELEHLPSAAEELHVSASEAYPQLIPELASMSMAAANLALRAGQIDLALVDDPIPDETLIIERLVDIGYGIYCGRKSIRRPLGKRNKTEIALEKLRELVGRESPGARLAQS